MDKQRTFFYGFIVGFAFMIIPIPEYFFWEGILEHIYTLFRYMGFILLVFCGLPLVYYVLRNVLKIDNQKSDL
jgi:putative Mn2+ efflux pump MntP